MGVIWWAMLIRKRRYSPPVTWPNSANHWTLGSRSCDKLFFASSFILAQQTRTKVGTMLVQRRRWWDNIKPALALHLMYTGYTVYLFFSDFGRIREFPFFFQLLGGNNNNSREILEFANLSYSQKLRKLKPREYYQIWSIRRQVDYQSNMRRSANVGAMLYKSFLPIYSRNDTMSACHRR